MCVLFFYFLDDILNLSLLIKKVKEEEINGSPREQGNTSILLQKSLEGAKSTGADIEIINLYDLNYGDSRESFLFIKLSI